MTIYIPDNVVDDDAEEDGGYGKSNPGFDDMFQVYTPVQQAENVDRWEIAGTDMQVLHFGKFAAGEEIVTEVGSTFYLSPGVETTVDCPPGDACSRICSGENCVKVKLANESGADGYVGLTPAFPAKIIPLRLSSSNTAGGVTSFVAKPGAIMAHVGDDVDVACDADWSPLRVCCAGLGCCRQRISGTDGTAFLTAGGTIVSRTLRADETITVDKNSIVGFADTVTLSTTMGGGACFCLCGGEGCLLPTLTGPGLVLLESMCFAKYKMAVQPTAQNMDRTSETSGDGVDAIGDVGAVISAFN